MSAAFRHSYRQLLTDMLFICSQKIVCLLGFIKRLMLGDASLSSSHGEAQHHDLDHDQLRRVK